MKIPKADSSSYVKCLSQSINFGKDLASSSAIQLDTYKYLHSKSASSRIGFNRRKYRLMSFSDFILNSLLFSALEDRPNMPEEKSKLLLYEKVLVVDLSL